MKQGTDITQILKELELREENRADYSICTNICSIISSGANFNFRLGSKEDDPCFEITEIAHRQICDWLGLPFKYYESLLIDKPTILLNMLNNFFGRVEDYRTLRIVNKKLVAFLSNCYLKYDNLELLLFANNLANETRGLNILSAELTPERLYIKIIDKRIKAKVSEDNILYAGYILSNSEVGRGSLKVEPLIYQASTKSCYIFKEFAKRIYHMDKSNEYISSRSSTTNSKIFYSETDNKDFLVSKLIADAMAEHPFAKSVAALSALSDEEIFSTGVFDRIKQLAHKYNLSVNEENQFAINFLKTNSNNWSETLLLDCMTRIGESDLVKYSRATNIERLCGEILLAHSKPKDQLLQMIA